MAGENTKNSGYKLARYWFDFALQNPDHVTGNHTALYMWLIELNNRLKWADKFGLTVREGMDGMSCKSRTTYTKCFKSLVEWGWVIIVKKSRNQYEANIIALPKNVQANKLWLTKNCATTGNGTGYTTGNGTGTIHINSKTDKQLNNVKGEAHARPTLDDAVNYFFEKKINRLEAEKFLAHYEGRGWIVSGAPVFSWQAMADSWILKIDKFEKKSEQKNGKSNVEQFADIGERILQEKYGDSWRQYLDE